MNLRTRLISLLVSMCPLKHFKVNEPALYHPGKKEKMNLRDRLYQVQKSGNDADRQRFKKVKYEVGCIKKKLFSYLKTAVKTPRVRYLSKQKGN